ncbi:MAG: fimbria/pilus periplasmic chaperone [Pseudomonadota bacterium]
MRAFRAAVLAFSLLLGLGSLAQAMEVQPLRVMLVPAEGRTAGTISVNNTRTDPLPYEISVERRIIAPDGSQTFTSAEDDFVVFPPQGLIEPGGTQAVRFQYLGPIELTETQGYVLRVKEVPVRDENFSGIQFAYSFGAAIYVKPADAEDDIDINSVARDGDVITVGMANSGNDYSLLTAKRLTFVIDGQRFNYGREELAQLIPNPLIAPNSERTLTITIADLPTGSIEELRFN